MKPMAMVMLGALAGGSLADAPQARDVAAAKAIVRALAEPRPLDSRQAARVRLLVGQLGSDTWNVRDRAYKELLAVGSSAASWAATALNSPDAEVSTRARGLLDAYRDTRRENIAELARAAETLAAAGDKWVVDALIKLLADGDLEVRYGAEYGLREVTGMRFGYSAYAAEADRQAAAARWLAWWRAAREGFDFQAPGRGRLVGVLAWSYSPGELVLVSLAGEVLWSKRFTSQLCAAAVAPNGNIVACLVDQGKCVAQEHTPDGKLVWSSESLDLGSYATDVQRLANGNTLIAGAFRTQVVEIDAAGRRIVWQHGQPGGCMSSAKSAQRLANGNTLICRYGGVLEVDRAGRSVWSYSPMRLPTDAWKLPNGNVLITGQMGPYVAEVSRQGETVWNWAAQQRHPASACRLPDGRTVVHVRNTGLMLVDPSGKTAKLLTDRVRGSFGKVRLVLATDRPAEAQAPR